MVETLGADTLVHGALVDKGEAVVPVTGEGGAVLAVRLAGNVAVREGEALPLRVADGALHVFDRETGKRFGGRVSRSAQACAGTRSVRRKSCPT